MRIERFDAESIDVEPGETIDFVVDLRDNLNHEEYLWEVSLTELPNDETRATGSWNSQQDFGGPATAQLDDWEQLAQVLLAANEFLFVD